jgi:hypothetical protein
MSAAIDAVDRVLTHDGTAEDVAAAVPVVAGTVETVVDAAFDEAAVAFTTALNVGKKAYGAVPVWAKLIAWNAAAAANGSRAGSAASFASARKVLVSMAPCVPPGPGFCGA